MTVGELKARLDEFPQGDEVVLSGDSMVLGDSVTCYSVRDAPRVENVSRVAPGVVAIWPDRDGWPDHPSPDPEDGVYENPTVTRDHGGATRGIVT